MMDCNAFGCDEKYFCDNDKTIEIFADSHLFRDEFRVGSFKRFEIIYGFVQLSYIEIAIRLWISVDIS